MLSSESEEYPEWKALLTEVLVAVAKRLTSIADYSSFRGVCTSWRCAATFDNFDREFPRAPRLLYFVKETEEGEGEEEEEEDREFPPAPRKRRREEEEEEDDEDEEGEGEGEEEAPVLDAGRTEEREEETIALSEVSEETPIHEKIVANFLDLESNTSKIAKFSPQIPYKYLSCPGWILVSCSGWILVSNKNDFSDEIEHSLKHFMLGINIKLPLLYMFVSKMVLSGSPMESGLVVMVICGYDDQLAFCRPGDEFWTVIDWRHGRCFFDIIYHNRKLYALNSALRIVECDIHGSNPTKLVEVFATSPYDNKFRCVEEQFLVESFGKFLLVLQYRSQNGSYYFRIFEIELEDGISGMGRKHLCYEEIDNIGDRCLFLGFNSSICVSSSSVGLKPNCIYFSKNKQYCSKPHVGVFYRLGDGGGEYFEDFSCRFDFCSPLPVWVVPSI